MYSPVFGFTRTFSPVFTNSGTLIVTPFSSLAGLVDAVFVAVAQRDLKAAERNLAATRDAVIAKRRTT